MKRKSKVKSEVNVFFVRLLKGVFTNLAVELKPTMPYNTTKFKTYIDVHYPSVQSSFVGIAQLRKDSMEQMPIAIDLN